MNDLGILKQRESAIWKRDALDYYVEPRWVDTRLFELETFKGTVWDPSCGSGRIPDAAVAAGYHTIASDIVDRGYENFSFKLDFMSEAAPKTFEPHNIACNPPYRISEAFIAKAIDVAERKVAMLMRATWVLGDERSRWIESMPLARVWFITPRPSMPPGAVIEGGGQVRGGYEDYAWFVFVRGFRGVPRIGWLRRDG